ncbi:YTH domain-containing protein 1-like [Pollicipes pollicipes]|uniref:YTH domain-containing protein 1-like n=1 Tax=Pollicipes pollicipes TaxID=41117 RepID=UPI001884A5C1|nr:YTH domain-containing protein 1-like [Pollicipes pollicipes]
MEAGGEQAAPGADKAAARELAAGDDNYDTRSEVSSSSKSLHSELSVDVDEGSEPSVSSDDEEEEEEEEAPPPPPPPGDKAPANGEKAAALAPASGGGGGSGGRESYLTKLNYLFRDARFFIIKSNNEENVALSKVRGVWSTPPQNEAKLNQAFRESRNVLLVFSVKESGRFCGFCRVSSESRRDLSPVSWVLPPGLPARALGGVFRVAWINKNDLPFPKTAHLYNPWNNGKPVKIGRDGQEVEPRVAEELCRRFARDDAIDMNPILIDSKRASRTVKTSKPLLMPTPPPMRRGRRDFRERGRSPPRFPPREPVPRMYPELMRELAARGAPLPPLPYPPPPPFDPMAPPRYYDGPPLPEFVPAGRSAERRMSEYDRSVEEFLRQTSAHRERSSRERRHRDRR